MSFLNLRSLDYFNIPIILISVSDARLLCEFYNTTLS